MAVSETVALNFDRLTDDVKNFRKRVIIYSNSDWKSEASDELKNLTEGFTPVFITTNKDNIFDPGILSFNNELLIFSDDCDFLKSATEIIAECASKKRYKIPLPVLTWLSWNKNSAIQFPIQSSYGLLLNSYVMYMLHWSNFDLDIVHNEVKDLARLGAKLTTDIKKANILFRSDGVGTPGDPQNPHDGMLMSNAIKVIEKGIISIDRQWLDFIVNHDRVPNPHETAAPQLLKGLLFHVVNGIPNAEQLEEKIKLNGGTITKAVEARAIWITPNVIDTEDVIDFDQMRTLREANTTIIKVDSLGRFLQEGRITETLFDIRPAVTHRQTRRLCSLEAIKDAEGNSFFVSGKEKLKQEVKNIILRQIHGVMVECYEDAQHVITGYGTYLPIGSSTVTDICLKKWAEGIHGEEPCTLPVSFPSESRKLLAGTNFLAFSSDKSEEFQGKLLRAATILMGYGANLTQRDRIINSNEKVHFYMMGRRDKKCIDAVVSAMNNETFPRVSLAYDIEMADYVDKHRCPLDHKKLEPFEIALNPIPHSTPTVVDNQLPSTSAAARIEIIADNNCCNTMDQKIEEELCHDSSQQDDQGRKRKSTKTDACLLPPPVKILRPNDQDVKKENPNYPIHYGKFALHIQQVFENTKFVHQDVYPSFQAIEQKDEAKIFFTHKSLPRKEDLDLCYGEAFHKCEKAASATRVDVITTIRKFLRWLGMENVKLCEEKILPNGAKQNSTDHVVANGREKNEIVANVTQGRCEDRLYRVKFTIKRILWDCILALDEYRHEIIKNPLTVICPTAFKGLCLCSCKPFPLGTGEILQPAIKPVVDSQIFKGTAIIYKCSQDKTKESQIITCFKNRQSIIKNVTFDIAAMKSLNQLLDERNDIISGEFKINAWWICEECLKKNRIEREHVFEKTYEERLKNDKEKCIICKQVTATKLMALSYL